MTNDRNITLDRFRELLDQWGARQERWPEDEIACATALLYESAEAQTLFKAAAALDALLETARKPEPSVALRDRVLALGPAGNRHTGMVTATAPSIAATISNFFAAMFRPAIAGAAVAGLALGIGVSTLLPLQQGAAPQPATGTETIAATPDDDGSLAPANAVRTPLVDSLGGGYTPTLAVVTEAAIDDQQDSGFQTANYPLY